MGNGPCCRKCGVHINDLHGAYLARVNEKGVPGIWECRPQCGATLTEEEAVLAALEQGEGTCKPE